MKYKVYMNSAGNNRERDILRAFHEGIMTTIPAEKSEYKKLRNFNKEIGLGLGVDFAYDEKYSKCDVAVMTGSWKPDRTNIHHTVRASVAEKAHTFICIETPLLGRKITHHHSHYRVGLNGFMNKDAHWGFEDNQTAQRFEELNLEYNGFRRRGQKIVIALQLAGDASLRHNDINDWVFDTAVELRRFSERPIEIRVHPAISDKGMTNHNDLFKRLAFAGLKDVKVVDGSKIAFEYQMQDAHSVITYSSGIAIDALLYGVPVMTIDEGGFAYDITEHKLINIENMHIPHEDEVIQLFYNLAWCQWTPAEMQDGTCINRLLPYISHSARNKGDE